MSEEEDIVKWLKRRRLTDVDYLDYNSVENIIGEYEESKNDIKDRYGVTLSSDYNNDGTMELWDYDNEKCLVRVYIFDEMLGEPIQDKIEEILNRERDKLQGELDNE